MQADQPITPTSNALPVLEDSLVAAVERVIGAAVSANTTRAYNAAFAKYCAWCVRRGIAPMPASPAVVATFLVDLAETGGTGRGRPRKLSTIALALSAIAAKHRDLDLPFEVRAPALRVALKGLRRTHAAPQAQAAALRPTMIRDILRELKDSPIDRRDGALLALLFAGALRRSELAGLDYDQPGVGDGYLQLSEVAVEIVLLRSKSRTEVETVRIPRADNPGLVYALERWIATGDVQPGTPLFRSIGKGGHVGAKRISEKGVSLVVKARVAKHLVGKGLTRAAADTEASRYSGHSGRVGLYVACSEAGVPIEAVAALARHKSLHVAQKYARHADQLRRAPSKNTAVAI